MMLYTPLNRAHLHTFLCEYARFSHRSRPRCTQLDIHRNIKEEEKNNNKFEKPHIHDFNE